jgi:cytochrome P450
MLAHIRPTTIVVSLMDFFTGGSGTISMTMSFCVLYLLHYPASQARILDECNQCLRRKLI